MLSSQKILTEFDCTVFESIIEKIIVGGVNSDGEIDPAMLTIIFKTGETQNKNYILKEQTTHIESVTVLTRK
ncbi:hypothetical protein DOPI104051_06810 [Dolosigranulum pigrum]|uniref:Uncharacterized protein n=1 Tax=Dolosigranulum pigrum ATCC 51524 TaxID=883103 RepID=H3NEE0_9LACT|nr:hypothetical protein HMPREF9703_00921 [Dolosigranulum pigrum ATCC 51524]